MENANVGEDDVIGQDEQVAQQLLSREAEIKEQIRVLTEELGRLRAAVPEVEGIQVLPAQVDQVPANAAEPVPPAGDVEPSVGQGGNVAAIGNVEQEAQNTIEARLRRQEAIANYVRERLPTIKEKPFYLHVSGPAGTGKSVLLGRCRDIIIAHFGGNENACLVTAPTGVAAVNVNGRTLHAQFLFDFEKRLDFPVEEDLKALQAKIGDPKVLIIDEISMVSSYLLARVDHILQLLQKKRGETNIQPFGGLSVIVFGDLLQLEPFETSNNGVIPPAPYVFEEMPDQIMQASRNFHTPNHVKPIWSLFEFVELEYNFRTTNEEQARLLRLIRTTADSFEEVRRLLETTNCVLNMNGAVDVVGVYQEYVKRKGAKPEMDFVILAAKKRIVKQINEIDLRNTDGDARTYKSILQSEIGSYPPKTIDRFVLFYRESQDGIEELVVKVGSKVMITCNVNLAEGLANGTIGTVAELWDHKIVVNIPNKGNVDIERQPWFHGNSKWFQFPLRLSAAMTIHKSQGITVDGVIVVTDGLFAAGQFYTAISRARHLHLSRITRFDNKTITLSKESVKELARLRRKRQIQL